MTVTEQDKLAQQVAGESASGGPKRLAVDDSGSLKLAEGQLGEMQDTPTAYTLLRRLKDIVTGLGTVILAAGTEIIGRVLPPVTVETPFTGTGNLAVGTDKIAPGGAFLLTEVSLHLNAAPTTGTQNLVLALDDGVNTAYDLGLLTIDLVANAVTDLVVKPNMACKATDVITAAWTNTDGKTYGLKFKHQLL